MKPSRWGVVNRLALACMGVVLSMGASLASAAEGRCDGERFLPPMPRLYFFPWGVTREPKSGPDRDWEAALLSAKVGAAGPAILHLDAATYPRDRFPATLDLTPDDLLLMNIQTRTADGQVCVALHRGRFFYAGWVRATALSVAGSSPDPAPRDWVGTWRDGRNTLSIRRAAKGDLSVEGASLGADKVVPLGVLAPVRVKPSGQYVRLKGRKACKNASGLGRSRPWMSLKLQGDWLVVQDNACGGAEGDFDGIYTRTAPGE